MGFDQRLRILCIFGVACLGLLVGAPPCDAGSVNASDLAVLKQLKSMYQRRVDLSSWNFNNGCSTWKWVACDGDRVSGIYFQGTWLQGPFPTVVTKLDKLRHWYGDSNNFTGPFPKGFSRLSRLEVLRLSGNQLHGQLPSEFGGLRRLYKFYVKQNYRLTGTIPPSWANLTMVEAYFDSNAFSGPFPSVICNWNILQRIRMGNNKWTGSIPNCITKLRGLATLYLDNIGLTGPIPPRIGNMNELSLVFLNGNYLTGPIPSSISALTKLQTLFLSGNNLGGPLPATLGRLTQLRELVMEFNRIDGSIPTEIGNMVSLQRILFDNNRLTGHIPQSFRKLTQLTMLLLEGNSLSGTIDNYIARNLVNLVQFNVETNWLTGAMPSVWGSSRLVQLNFLANYFTGRMDFKTTNGQRICPPMRVNDWIHSSTALNCLTGNSTCGTKYDERQRTRAVCNSFCGALRPRGACNGKGTCLWVTIKGRKRAMCRCNPGTRRSKDGYTCS